MSNIINLRQARKRKKRADAQTRSSENRAKFGTTKVARKLHEAEEAQSKKLLDGAKLEKDD